MAKGVKVVETQMEFDNLPPGNHYVKGFEFIGMGDSEEPVFSFDEYKGMSTKIRFINVVDNQPGAPMSISPAELVGLVHMFGAEDFLPTKESRELPSVMLEGMKKANAVGKTLSINVGDKGWVKYVSGLRPPQGRYFIKFSGVYPTDSTFIQGSDNNGYLYLYFTIVAEASLNNTKRDSIWEGMQVSTSLSNPFITEDGKITAQALGYPMMKEGITSNRWFNFGTFFCDNIWHTYNWLPNEVLEPHKVLIQKAKETKAEVVAYYKQKDKSDNWHFVLEDLDQFNEVHSDRVADITEFVTFVKSKTWYNADEKEMEHAEIFETENPLAFVLTPDAEGKQHSVWGRRYLKTAWQQAGLNVDDNSFATKTPQELGRLMDAMETLYGK